MRGYLANKMTGKPQCNFPWFDAEAARLRSLGHDVVSPAELDRPEVRVEAMASEHCESQYATGETWGDFLARDIKMIVDDGIEVIWVGPEWMDSKGARLETFVAHLAGIPVLNSRTGVPVSMDDQVNAWAGLSRNGYNKTYVPHWLAVRAGGLA